MSFLAQLIGPLRLVQCSHQTDFGQRIFRVAQIAFEYCHARKRVAQILLKFGGFFQVLNRRLEIAPVAAFQSAKFASAREY